MENLKCRNENCQKEFSNSSNRAKHEKRFKHYTPALPRQGLVPLCDEQTKKYECTKQFCEVNVNVNVWQTILYPVLQKLHE